MTTLPAGRSGGGGPPHGAVRGTADRSSRVGKSEAAYEFFVSTLAPQQLADPLRLGGPLLEIDARESGSLKPASGLAAAQIAGLAQRQPC